MDIMTKLKEKRRLESERFAGIRDHAIKQGLVIVKVSPRVYHVVTLSNSTSCTRFVLESVGVTEDTGRFVTHLEGEVVFRGNWVQCKVFVDKHAVPLPPELAPQ